MTDKNKLWTSQMEWMQVFQGKEEKDGEEANRMHSM